MTFNQELLVAKIGSELVKFKARLAGAKIDDDKRRRRKRPIKNDEDHYGKMLEFRRRMKDAEKEFADFSDCMKPL